MTDAEADAILLQLIRAWLCREPIVPIVGDVE